MQKRRFRGLAIFLSIALCFTMIPGIAFADHNSSTTETKNLLVFGASTSSGYGVDDFYNSNAGFAIDNNDLEDWTYEKAINPKENPKDRGRISERSYPWKLKQYIQETEGVKVDLSAMCLNGMRTNELHALLDEDYYQAVYNWEKTTTAPSYNSDARANDDIGFLTNHIRSFVCHLGQGGAEINGESVATNDSWSESGLPGGADYKKASDYTKKEIENADVIVVDVAMNNFGTYLAERIAGKHHVPGKEYAENYWKQELKDNVGVSEKTIEIADKLKKTLKETVSALDNENTEEFLDSFIYCFTDFMANFSADIELIRKINPKAKIIAVGVYNTLDGINLVLDDGTEDGKKIDFGELSAKGFSLVNSYIKGLDKNSNNYYYADVSSGIETFMNQIRNAESFEALMADDSGAFLMDNLYTDFMASYHLTGMFNDDPKVNYNDIKDKLEGMFKNGDNKTLAMKEFSDLEKDETVAATGYVIDYNGTKGVVPTDDQTGVTYLTKAMMTEEQYNQLKEGVEANFTQGNVKMAAMKDWGDLGDDEKFTISTYVVCTGDKANPYFVTKDPNDEKAVYLTKDRVPSKKNIQELLYNAGKVEDIHLDKLMSNLVNMKNIEDDIQAYILQKKDPSEATMELLQIVDRFILYQGVGQHPSKKGCESMYQDVKVAYDKLMNGGNTAFEDAKEELLGLITSLLKQTGAAEDVDKIMDTIQKIGEVLKIIDEENLTPEQLKEFLELKKNLETKITNVLNYFDITAEDLMNALDDEENLEKIAKYVEKIQKLNEAINLLESKGFKLELDEEQLNTIIAIKDDLSSLVKKVMDKLNLDADSVKDLLKNPETADKIVEAVTKIAALNEALDMLKKNGIDLSKDQLQKLLEMKDDLTSLVNDVIDRFGLEADDVKDLLKNPETADKIVEAVGKLIAINEAVELLEKEGLDLSKDQLQKLFALRDEAHARFDEALELLGVSMDDIAKFIDKNTTPEKLAQYARQIEAVKAVLDRLPKSKEELKAELEKKYEVVKKIIGEEGAKRLEAIFNTIKTIDFKNMSEDQIVQILKPIYEIIGELVEAVWYLPEYEQLIDEDILPRLLEVETENAELRAQANDLQNQVTKLKAKSIFAMPKASLAIANKKATVNVSWEKDEDAAGYVFKVNGKETNFKEGKAAMTYSANAVIGKAYTFEVTPYLEDGAKKISGKTFKITFVPKVKVAKAKIKRVKKNAKSFKVKWKKVKNADGYQVYYKAAGKKAKKKLVKSGNKTALKIKKAKKVKKYRVNVRAYRIVNGKKYFGAWSNTKKVKYK